MPRAKLNSSLAEGKDKNLRSQKPPRTESADKESSQDSTRGPAKELRGKAAALRAGGGPGGKDLLRGSPRGGGGCSRSLLQRKSPALFPGRQALSATLAHPGHRTGDTQLLCFGEPGAHRRVGSKVICLLFCFSKQKAVVE